MEHLASKVLGEVFEAGWVFELLLPQGVFLLETSYLLGQSLRASANLPLGQLEAFLEPLQVVLDLVRVGHPSQIAALEVVGLVVRVGLHRLDGVVQQLEGRGCVWYFEVSVDNIVFAQNRHLLRVCTCH